MSSRFYLAFACVVVTALGACPNLCSSELLDSIPDRPGLCDRLRRPGWTHSSQNLSMPSAPFDQQSHPSPRPGRPPFSLLLPGHGTCSIGDICDCYDNWMGPDCSLRVCPQGNSWALDSSTPHSYEECSGAGLCDRCVALPLTVTSCTQQLLMIDGLTTPRRRLLTLPLPPFPPSCKPTLQRKRRVQVLRWL
jgi:hypothetical protein